MFAQNTFYTKYQMRKDSSYNQLEAHTSSILPPIILHLKNDIIMKQERFTNWLLCDFLLCSDKFKVERTFVYLKRVLMPSLSSHLVVSQHNN